MQLRKALEIVLQSIGAGSRPLRYDVVGIGLSALCLLAYLIGGERLLLTSALVLPLIVFFILQKTALNAPPNSDLDGLTGLKSVQHLKKQVQSWLAQMDVNQRKTACFLIRIDEFPELIARHGETASQQIQRAIAARILLGLREDDILTRTREGEFMFVLTPVRHLDLEICVQLATRLKATIEGAIPVGKSTIRITASIGFCRNDQIPDCTFANLSEAAKIALRDARRNGESSLRAYSESMRKREEGFQKLSTEAARALQQGEIHAWFQPQVSTETGAITGFEALARWQHPERGVVSPAEFLDTLAETGQLERLADLMLQRALEAQNNWERHGYNVPHVGVNFAGEELRNPMLVEKIHWELDRYELSPDRVAIEVLETVIADAADGAVSRNVNGLANLGCYIDLDDFGTGHSSISSIRKFAVSRLKIDRSFVMHVDTDPEQRRMVSAIVTMAERLGLETLAEGVETEAEHAMLAQLGCSHVQGYGIARPMPFEQTIPWMKEYLASIPATPAIARRFEG